VDFRALFVLLFFSPAVRPELCARPLSAADELCVCLFPAADEPCAYFFPAADDLRPRLLPASGDACLLRAPAAVELASRPAARAVFRELARDRELP
jgi:hypothetical protein